jgi:putative salt-induced outer membrane protein YdiY
VELQLANGDRLRGEIIWRTDGKIRFRSPILGDLTLAETDAAVQEIPEALNTGASEQVNPGPHPAKSVAAAAEATKGQTPATGHAPVSPVANQAAAPAKESWKGKVELGSVQQTGRADTLSYNARAEVEKNVRRHALRGNARVLYAEQNKRVSADRQDASVRWRYQLSKRTFAQAQTTYYADEITQIETNLEQNAGLGYRLLDLPGHTLNVGGGATAQYRDWNAGTNGAAPYAEIFQDYTFKVNDRITFIQDAVAQYSPSDRAFNLPYRGTTVATNPDEQNYKVRLNGTLQGKVTEKISVNLRFEFELDNAIKLESARETQRITSAIGYAF